MEPSGAEDGGSQKVSLVGPQKPTQSWQAAPGRSGLPAEPPACHGSKLGQPRRPGLKTNKDLLPQG